MKRPLSWVPWHIDSWLFGSSRHELTRAQRSDFLDLALIAGKDEGFIRANETTPYPITQLAGLLCVPAADLEETIERCIEVGKLERRENGVLYVVNWERYKLTPQYRRRLKPRSPSASSSKIKEEKSRGEERKGRGNHVSKEGNIVSQKGNTSPSLHQQKEEIDEERRRRPNVDPYVGANPKRTLSEEEIASWRKSAEREIRSSAIRRGLKGDDLESAVRDALKDWDRDQRQ